MQAILAIDQGTTSTRAILFSQDGQLIAQAQQALSMIYPQPGWVEQDAEAIWQSTLHVCREVLSNNQTHVAALGITNQRETTVLWDKQSGEVLYNAIVWQDRRTAPLCEDLQKRYPKTLWQRTGLLLDPYFSASKIAWLLDTVPDARERAIRGELAFGTIDSFLIWRLTGGQRHVIDITNASRTLLFNLSTQTWDTELLDAFAIPDSILPSICANDGDFGQVKKSHFGISLPITGVAGDQQAALIGQACLERGMAKCTYGTGAFLLANTGTEIIASTNRLLSTIAYQVQGKTAYAMEGSIFIAGAVIQWLREEMGLFADANETANIAASLSDNEGVYFIPAFTGLGAPYWQPHARGAIIGLTRNTRQAHIVRAALEAVVYQTRDLLKAIQDDGADLANLRIDGGMVVNPWFTQFLADILQVPVQKPKIIETTAQGAAFLAGLGCGLYESLETVSQAWQQAQAFKPQLSSTRADSYYAAWQQAVNLLL